MANTTQNTKFQVHQGGDSVSLASGGTFTADSGSTTALNGTITTTNGVGAVNGATVSAVELGNGIQHQTVITLTATPVGLLDSKVGGGVKIYDFPPGRILIQGAVGSFAFTTTTEDTATLNAAKTANWGLGSVITLNQGSGTLATTEQDIIPTTNYTTAAKNTASSASGGMLAASAQFDGTTASLDCHLNIGVATATDIDGDATVTATGAATITWINLGDL